MEEEAEAEEEEGGNRAADNSSFSVVGGAIKGRAKHTALEVLEDDDMVILVEKRVKD